MYSPDGLLVAAGSWSGLLKIWDSSNGACLHSLDLDFAVYKIIFSIDGSRLAVNTHKTYLLFNLTSRTPRLLTGRAEPENEEDDRGTMAMSLPGDRMVIGRGSKAEIWSTVSGEHLLDLNEHAAKVTSVAFSPDGAEVAAASTDHTVVVCESQTGQRRCVHEMPSMVNSVAYSPNGSFIAIGDRTGRIRVCDTKSGIFIADLEGHTRAVEELQFTADSRNLLSRSDDGTARMWSVRDVMRIR